MSDARLHHKLSNEKPTITKNLDPVFFWLHFIKTALESIILGTFGVENLLYLVPNSVFVAGYQLRPLS